MTQSTESAPDIEALIEASKAARAAWLAAERVCRDASLEAMALEAEYHDARDRLMRGIAILEGEPTFNTQETER